MPERIEPSKGKTCQPLSTVDDRITRKYQIGKVFKMYITLRENWKFINKPVALNKGWYRAGIYRSDKKFVDSLALRELATVFQAEKYFSSGEPVGDK